MATERHGCAEGADESPAGARRRFYVPLNSSCESSPKPKNSEGMFRGDTGARDRPHKTSIQVLQGLFFPRSSEPHVHHRALSSRDLYQLGRSARPFVVPVVARLVELRRYTHAMRHAALPVRVPDKLPPFSRPAPGDPERSVENFVGSLSRASDFLLKHREVLL